MQKIQLEPFKKSIQSEINIPGSKSITNRALIMGALAKNPVEILHPLASDDVVAMISCLRALGIEIQQKEGKICVVGNIDDVKEGTYHLNTRLSGTTMRFITALSCIVPGVKSIQGEGRLNARPIGDLVKALMDLGATIGYGNTTSGEVVPPLSISSSKLTGSRVTLSATVSSQYMSALLMIAPVIGGLHITIKGSPISQSYTDLTIAMMHEWGIEVNKISSHTYHVASGEYDIRSYTVEGDYSAAAYFGAIAALTKSCITIYNITSDTKQGDKYFFHILERMGNTVQYHQTSVTVIGKGVKKVAVNMQQCPDQAQTVAVLAAFAKGKTVLTGVRSLRVKETERVKAVQTELAKMGIKTESPDADTLIIYGGNPQPATIDTYNDHRMALSFAVAGAKLEGMKINNPQVVQKTFPDYWEKLTMLGMINEQ